jgi:hypothetical protein
MNWNFVQRGSVDFHKTGNKHTTHESNAMRTLNNNSNMERKCLCLTKKIIIYRGKEIPILQNAILNENSDPKYIFLMMKMFKRNNFKTPLLASLNTLNFK